MGFFDKMFSGLTKTRKNIEDLEEVFRNYDIDSEDFYDELEEMLIMADVGGETTAQIMMDYKRILLRRYINKGKAAKEAFVGYMQDMLGNMDTKLKLDTKPSVILMVGVNGVGKTTTIGKLAASLKAEGKNVLLCAGDTFRAAAAEQLGVSPTPFMMTAAVAASACFATPICTPPNAMVMNAGHYNFMDYVKVGLPLQIIMGIVAITTIPIFFPF